MWAHFLRTLLATTSVWLLNKYRQKSLELIKLEAAIGYVKGVRSARQAFLAVLVVVLGAGLLAQAWSDAPAPLRLRAGWRLTPQAAEAPWRAASGREPAGARALCLQHLGQTEPTWLSLPI